ncbi:MAG TPA: hypothetical protein VIL74_07280 [Pyrinomonadaceae bacterium]
MEKIKLYFSNRTLAGLLLVVVASQTAWKCPWGSQTPDPPVEPTVRTGGFEWSNKTLASLGSILGTPIGGVLDATFGGLLDRFGDNLKRVTENAVAGGDYLTEKGARQANLIVQNAAIAFGSELDKSIKNLSIEQQSFVARLAAISDDLSNAAKGLIELEDFVALDAQNFLNGLPLTNNIYLIRTIRGYGQVYRPTGNYTFSVIGNAFGPNYHNVAKVGDYNIRPTEIRLDRVHTFEFSVPAQALNQYFKDGEAARVPFEISSYDIQSNRLVFTHKDQFLLFPKYPIKFEVEQLSEEPKWSAELYDSQIGDNRLPPTEESGRWINGIVSTSIPNDCKMEKGTEQVWTDRSGWNSFDANYIYSNADHTVSRRWSHQIHDQSQTAYIKVKYRQPRPGNNTLPVVLRPGIEVQNDRMSFGTIFSQPLRAGFTAYTFKFTTFNGETGTTSNSKSSDGIVTTNLEGSGNARRLRIDVRAPF